MYICIYIYNLYVINPFTFMSVMYFGTYIHIYICEIFYMYCSHMHVNKYES